MPGTLFKKKTAKKPLVPKVLLLLFGLLLLSALALLWVRSLPSFRQVRHSPEKVNLRTLRIKIKLFCHSAVQKIEAAAAPSRQVLPECLSDQCLPSLPWTQECRVVLSVLEIPVKAQQSKSRKQPSHTRHIGRECWPSHTNFLVTDHTRLNLVAYPFALHADFSWLAERPRGPVRPGQPWHSWLPPRTLQPRGTVWSQGAWWAWRSRSPILPRTSRSSHWSLKPFFSAWASILSDETKACLYEIGQENSPGSLLVQETPQLQACPAEEKNTSIRPTYVSK